MKKIILFENWGKKFWEIGPKPVNSYIKYKNVGDIKLGDTVAHYTKGIGTIYKLDDDNHVAHIKFDDTGDTGIFYTKILISSDYLMKVVNKNTDTVRTPNTKNEITIDENENDIYEADFDDDDDDDDYVFDDLTEEELLEMTIYDLFDENDLQLLVTIDDLINYKNKLKTYLDKTFNPIKDKVNRITLNNLEKVENYYNILSEKFPGKDVYKFNGKIPYDDLWEIRKKFKINDTISDIDEYIKTGFIFYWEFKDSVVFKTK